MFSILLVRDIFEILFYSACIFMFCTWLMIDKSKNLVLYFLSYCIFTLCCWVFQLPTLSSFLITYAPIVFLFFIIVHERTLQRNFIALSNRVPSPSQEKNNNWLEILMQSALITINDNKSITVIIEHTDSLDSYLATSFFINADLSKNLLDIFFSSIVYDTEKMIWITIHNKIKAIQVSWITPERKPRENALFYTSLNDCIVLITCPLTRTFTVIGNGKETTKLSAHQTNLLIKKEFFKHQKETGTRYENNTYEKSIF